MELVKLIDKVSGGTKDCLYRIVYQEQDSDYPEIIWYYLESEFEDDNIHNHHLQNIQFAEIVASSENRIIPVQ